MRNVLHVPRLSRADLLTVSWTVEKGFLVERCRGAKFAIGGFVELVKLTFQRKTTRTIVVLVAGLINRRAGTFFGASVLISRSSDRA